jgi:hypothetical protein
VLHTPTSPAAPDTGQLLSVTAVPGTRPGRVVVEVVGEVDAYTAPALDVCLHSQARQRGVRELVVDLSRVTFLGAAGVTVLAQAHRGAGCAGRGWWSTRAGSAACSARCGSPGSPTSSWSTRRSRSGRAGVRGRQRQRAPGRGGCRPGAPRGCAGERTLLWMVKRAMAVFRGAGRARGLCSA